MNTVKKNEKVERAVQLFREFITVDRDPESIVKMIDDLIIEYACYLINDANAGQWNRADRLYLLHELKCVCKGESQD